MKPSAPAPTTFRVRYDWLRPSLWTGQKVTVGSSVYVFCKGGRNDQVWTCNRICDINSLAVCKSVYFTVRVHEVQAFCVCDSLNLTPRSH